MPMNKTSLFRAFRRHQKLISVSLVTFIAKNVMSSQLSSPIQSALTANNDSNNHKAL
jgi:hypothetical protein